MSMMRISGIASGLDTEQMVNDLMKAHRVKLERLEQDKQLIEWRQEIYNDLNKSWANFILDTKKDFGLNYTTSAGVILNKSVSSLEWVKKASSSEPDFADVTARADAVNGYYEVTVTSTASNVSVGSAESLGNLDVLKNQFGLADGAKIKFTISHKDGRSHTFSYSEEDLTTKTIENIVKDINNYKDENGKNLGVRAVYDRTINRFFLQTTETGEANGFKIEESGTVNFMTGPDDKLKLGLTFDESTPYLQGTNARLSFGGAQNIEMGTNQFTINGINFDLKKEGSFTVSVNTDVNGVYSKIESFVNKYNEMIEKISNELGEKRYRDYLPLTAEQKESMSDKEIELWEQKAKSGLLKNDLIFDGTLTKIRSGMYQAVEGLEGIFNHLTGIGITTESFTSGSKGGKLVIDKNSLTKAIEKDVDSVLELLFKEPSEQLKLKPEAEMTSDQIAQKRRESGLIGRLYDNIVAGMKDVIVKSGTGDNADLYRNVNSLILVDFVTEHSSISMLDEETTNLTRRIDDMNDYLVMMEDKYWRQFTAMEKALNQMNQQSAWLAQQFMQS